MNYYIVKYSCREREREKPFVSAFKKKNKTQRPNNYLFEDDNKQ